MRIKIKQPVESPARQTGRGGVTGHGHGRRKNAGFTLVEVIIAAAIVGLVFGGVINSYIQAGKRIEWTGYSLAAQSLATEMVEQAKAGVWDPAQQPPENDLTNMNLMGVSYNTGTKTYSGYSVSILDVPYKSTNAIVATNYVTIQMLYVAGNSNVPAQFIRVDTVWPFGLETAHTYFTNTICTMVAPDNRSNGTF
jgi:prepilin-type N-terminal cleavage/methylation domain-containing protein